MALPSVHSPREGRRTIAIGASCTVEERRGHVRGYFWLPKVTRSSQVAVDVDVGAGTKSSKPSASWTHDTREYDPDHLPYLGLTHPALSLLSHGRNSSPSTRHSWETRSNGTGCYWLHRSDNGPPNAAVGARCLKGVTHERMALGPYPCSTMQREVQQS